MDNISKILRGWANHFADEFNLLPDNIKELSEKRLTICNSCPLRTDYKCDKYKSGPVKETFIYNNVKREKGEIHNGCNCPIDVKSKSPNSQCPLNNW